MPAKKPEVLRGTLDLMILRTLSLEPMHGYGLGQRLEQITAGVVDVRPGSLFPALYRIEQKGWIRGEWRTSENRRRARYYSLTAAGKRRLAAEKESWDQFSLAVQKVLRAT